MNTASEYITPLDGIPYYESTGIIKAVDEKGSCFSVGEISYQRFDDQNFQYVITPYWEEIQYLPINVFDGIPGIDMEPPREHYYRVNMTPAFIEMRTPSASREDLWELLEAVGMDYYDRFEWMLRARKRCGDDNLIVVRKRSPRVFSRGITGVDLNDIQRNDEIQIESLSDLPVKNHEINYTMFRLLASGAAIEIKRDHHTITPAERSGMVYLLQNLISFANQYPSVRQREGIQRAKEEKKYQGRKKQPVDPIMLERVAEEYHNKRIDEAAAMKKLGIQSRSTFFRRMRELR